MSPTTDFYRKMSLDEPPTSAKFLTGWNGAISPQVIAANQEIYVIKQCVEAYQFFPLSLVNIWTG